MFYFFINLFFLILGETLTINNITTTYLVLCLFILYPVVYSMSTNRLVFLSNFNDMFTIQTATNCVVGIKRLCSFFSGCGLFFLRWKPVFRKTSYFGLYRANRNRWNNK